MSASLARHFWTGLWVALFGLVGIPLALIYAGVITIGDLQDNPMILAVLVILYFFVAVTFGGWAARMGVARVR